MCGGSEVIRRQLAPVADAVVQGRRLFGRLDAQLSLQDLAAGLVLGQGRAALAACGQQEHQLPVRFLPPRLQGQQAGGIVDAGRRPGLPLSGIVGDQRVQGLQGQLAQPRPLGQDPLFKGRRLAHIEPLQKVAPVELDRAPPAARCRLAQAGFCESTRTWSQRLPRPASSGSPGRTQRPGG